MEGDSNKWRSITTVQGHKQQLLRCSVGDAKVTWSSHGWVSSLFLWTEARPRLLNGCCVDIYIYIYILFCIETFITVAINQYIFIYCQILLMISTMKTFMPAQFENVRTCNVYIYIYIYTISVFINTNFEFIISVLGYL